MTTYTFNFDALTIGDFCTLIRASVTADLGAFYAMLDKACPGVLAASMSEIPNVIHQFNVAMAAYAQRLTEEMTPDALRLIRQALSGEQDSAL